MWLAVAYILLTTICGAGPKAFTGFSLLYFGIPRADSSEPIDKTCIWPQGTVPFLSYSGLLLWYWLIFPLPARLWKGASQFPCLLPRNHILKQWLPLWQGVGGAPQLPRGTPAAWGVQIQLCSVSFSTCYPSHFLWLQSPKVILKWNQFPILPTKLIHPWPSHTSFLPVPCSLPHL